MSESPSDVGAGETFATGSEWYAVRTVGGIPEVGRVTIIGHGPADILGVTYADGSHSNLMPCLLYGTFDEAARVAVRRCDDLIDALTQRRARLRRQLNGEDHP